MSSLEQKFISFAEEVKANPRLAFGKHTARWHEIRRSDPMNSNLVMQCQHNGNVYEVRFDVRTGSIFSNRMRTNFTSVVPASEHIGKDTAELTTMDRFQTDRGPLVGDIIVRYDSQDGQMEDVAVGFGFDISEGREYIKRSVYTVLNEQAFAEKGASARFELPDARLVLQRKRAPKVIAEASYMDSFKRAKSELCQKVLAEFPLAVKDPRALFKIVKERIRRAAGADII